VHVADVCVRVLLVEDDDGFAESLSQLLDGDERFEIAGRARDGREAIRLAEALDLDVVLMDIGLPEIDGIEATRVIGDRRPGLPVVTITGFSYEERALEARDAGAVDFIRKDRLGPDLADALAAAARTAHEARS
jgi:DNA-binding NarL/FixJ family response regulator